MNREHHAWHSPSLGRRMELLVFGHDGEPVIAFPTSGGRFHEWEDFGMVAAVRERLDAGQLQLFCLDAVDRESWYNRRVHPVVRVARDDQYDRYLVHEVVPFVKSRNWRSPTLAGASFGAYHVVDKGLRHPDVFRKLVAMSGSYDMRPFLGGHYDFGVHVHQPLDYLPNLSDHWFLERMRGQHIVIAAGDQDFLLPAARTLSERLWSKAVPNTLDVWGGYVHDWPAWRGMLGKHVGW
jgi:esterase/lipase superfamily enzyme